MTMPTVTVARRYLTAAFLIVLGLLGSGCGDSATVNPVVELASLTVSPGTLQPAFTGGTTEYNVNLTSNVTSVTITAQPAVAGDTVAINGQTTTSSVVPLGAAGTTTPVSIVVSESNTNSRTYTVLLVRAGLTGNNSLQSLTVSPGTLAPTFDPNLQTYTVDVANNVGIVTVTPTPSDPAAKMTVNGQATTSGQARTITLNPAGQDTAITIVVTAQNNSTKIYTVTVSRGVSGNNNLQNLTVSPGTLSPDFTPSGVGYRVNLPATLPGNVTSVRVTPTLQDATASMTVNGQPATSGQAQATPLPGPGSSTFINIVVTAQNGTQKTYSVNVIRAALGANDNLQGLTVSPGTLTPAFNANTQDYTVAVASNVGSVTVTPTLSDPAATMTVNGQATNSGQGRPVPLNGPGSTTVINIVVTAQNGSRNPYVVAVTRAQSSDNNLSALTVTPGTLAPAFAEGTLAYAVDVATDVTQVTVSATKSDPNAVLSGSITDPGVGQATGQATIQLGAPGTSTPVTITVTAPNGISKTYGLTVNRAAPSSDNNLAALTVTGGPLVPDFAPSTTAYMVNVPAAVASVTVSATKSDPGAVMSGDVTAGTGVATGQATFDQLVPLTPRIVSITVIAANGVPKPYSITITRALF
ncbi:MAG: cadherin-like beta sandwich domain-containing protein [Nitrospira sp.]|nr:cadherin-like beta sandwich domain-containing protein [Nitrospira sp.]